ncbi:NAD(P)-binding protein [Cystobasidium minutum MCA 4210]|uniref:NAD(P)-binding protein n=1 Tax=Cystobasidium minutum MCA 4210 TaxID=1397322 RepID=UPI0034CF5504|eukprot:jgi/Rhomi1/193272/gm1.1486_g
MKISGNGWIVTGGLGGLGRVIATSLLAEGGSVVLWDVLPQEKGEQLAKQLNFSGYISVDITNSESAGAAAKKSLELLSGVKLVGCVHCAGIALRRDWTNKMADSIAQFKKMLDVNTFGTFVVNAHVSDAINSQYPDQAEQLPPRVNEERGIIVNYASAAARPYARVLGYGPTKTAVVGITKSAADYLGPSGIRVCCVSPSIVATGMNGPHIPYFESQLEKSATFPRRQAQPSEMWMGTKYLIENEMMNAFDLHIDGNWHLVSDWAPGTDPRALAPGLE